MAEQLSGSVERVTFHNPENGFCVLRLKARGHRDLVTTVGHAAMISAGEWVTASGEWTNDRTHGQQFRARFLKTSAPSSIEGIEKYLGSGMIRGIGPVYARRMVRLFDKDVFDIIEASPERLREVDGIGPMRAAKITSAWADQKIIRERRQCRADFQVIVAHGQCNKECAISLLWQLLTIFASHPHLFAAPEFDKNAAPPYMGCQPLLFFTKGLYDLASPKAHAAQRRERASANGPGPSG